MIVASRARDASSARIVAGALAVVVFAIAASAARAMTPEARHATAVVATTASAETRFGDLPRFPHSDPVGDAVSAGGTVSRTFAVEDADADAVLEFYTDALVEWTPLRDVVGTPPRTAQWASDGYTLTIAVDAPGGASRTRFHVMLTED